MSSNLAVINFSVGGTLTISGKTTLADELTSINTARFDGISTTSLSVSDTSTFNGSLPTSTQTPTSDSQLTTKIYVDSADAVLDSRIADTDAEQKIYIDDADAVLDSRITDTDATQKIYIDDADAVLDTRITDTNAEQKIYIDSADTVLDTRITNIGIKPLFYVHQTSNNTQLIPANTMTKVSYSVALHNILQKVLMGEARFTGGGYAGYYQLNASVCLPNITSGYIAIFKNGSEYSRGSSFSSLTTSADTTLTVSTILYLNGASRYGDYCECQVICSPETVISGSISKTYFSGHFIQP